ncbi:MAG: hypothetical protein ACYS7Y_33095, partial [Planctomycetota bacterium]
MKDLPIEGEVRKHPNRVLQLRVYFVIAIKSPSKGVRSNRERTREDFISGLVIRPWPTFFRYMFTSRA